LSEHAVVVVGGGPTGMMLAAELTLSGIDVAILEKRATRDLESARSGGLHARTIEVLDQRGVAERFVSEGTVAQVTAFAMVPLDISDFPSRHPHGLALWQNRFEGILAGWVDELGVPIHREREVTGLTQDDVAVSLQLADGSTVRAQYVVGCDGGRSIIRKAAGIDFAGWDATTSSLVAEAKTSEQPELGMLRDEKGIHAIGPLEGGERMRMVVREGTIRRGEPTLEDLSRALIAVRGTDYGVHSPTWISRFTDTARQAASYRQGRVLLAGDAAHVHSPVGGQGLNTGIQDAVNLGWKLAHVIRGWTPDSLLDSYHGERHPVAARVLKTTLAQTTLMRSDARIDALLEFLSQLLAMDEPRRCFGGMMSGLDIAYDLGDGHPLVGRRMPDLDVETASGQIRLFSLLHRVQPALLNLGEPGALSDHASPWSDRVPLVDAVYRGAWQLPVIGEVSAPSAVLVRPDGHVAWAGVSGPAGLREALVTWFGEPAAA
jgi:3-(3-hydroxy-phenyl)propionate hydroxylase